MIHFESEQDEANFWGRSRAMLSLEIKQREKELQNLKQSVNWGGQDLEHLKSRGVAPELSDEEFNQILMAEYKYGQIFKQSSYMRYLHRKRLWTEVHKINRGAFKHHLWWMLHNIVAHIAIGLVPCKFSFKLHDWTSLRLNQPWKQTTYRKMKDVGSLQDLQKIAEDATWKGKGVN